MKKQFITILLIILCLLLTGCKKKDEVDDGDLENPIIVITLSNGKTITCELYPEVAPITVKNFLNLVDSNYYDGTVFHRIIANFMIQTGGYTLKDNTIYEMPEVKNIKGEFSSNGVNNDITHVAGVISMARAQAYNSASNQFFITVADSTYLDGNYAAFGKVVDEESLNNAIEVSKIKTQYVNSLFQDFPTEPISIVSIKRK